MLIYAVLSAAFAVIYWYVPLWTRSLGLPAGWWWLPYSLWLLPVIILSSYEANSSGDARTAAYATALFWSISILVYYSYYTMVAVLPIEGMHWLSDAINFFYGAVLRKIILWEMVSLVGGMTIGYLVGRVSLLVLSKEKTAGIRT